MLTRVRNVVLDVFGLPVVWRGPGTSRRVALTFDDGPQPLTGAYLDALDRLGVPATFFVMGDLTAGRPEAIRDYQRRGHQVGSHGWDHTAFPELGAGALRDQLRRTDAVIGLQPSGRRWVRPPYGKTSPRVIAQLAASGYMTALWSYDSKDHGQRDVDKLVARCDPKLVSPGDVILFHEGQEWTLAALPMIVGRLRDAGFDCVTMADMFAE